MPNRSPIIGTDATSTITAHKIPSPGGSSKAVHTANVSAARTAAIRIPTIWSVDSLRWPVRNRYRADPSTRTGAAVGSAGMHVERGREHGPAVTVRQVLRRLSERAEPRPLGSARRARVFRPAATLDR